MNDRERVSEVLLSARPRGRHELAHRGIRYPWDYSGVYTLTITARSCSSGFPEEQQAPRVHRAFSIRLLHWRCHCLSTSRPSRRPSGGGTFAGAVKPTGEIALQHPADTIWD